MTRLVLLPLPLALLTAACSLSGGVSTVTVTASGSTTSSGTAPSGAPPAATAPAPAATPASILSGLPAFATVQQAHQYAADQTATRTGDNPVVTNPDSCPGSSTQPSGCYVLGSTPASNGQDEVTFTDGVTHGGGGAAAAVFLNHDAARWHCQYSWLTQNGVPSNGATTWVKLAAGCANVRGDTSTGAPIVGCVDAQKQVTIDREPVFAGDHVWFHVTAPAGWMALDALVPSYAPGRVVNGDQILDH